ncbi:hypothetical protein MJ_1626 [Methanocaldococcus jannaschii DSM 2661]|uniref:Uncharacterized protein MJ1626 n=3 Tax=Methanocaldococcus jannaschii TaxID=2190 RepID=Y1626_METJA|nr:RecName: Full=Uncharacterized protein MJ1626 [Methanocaldococcus jannaschii DSM 2661]AAB99649.1 hypothetical protein MJ_1626 [Methanocaldococcus jannaschii DSM 2661]
MLITSSLLPPSGTWIFNINSLFCSLSIKNALSNLPLMRFCNSSTTQHTSTLVISLFIISPENIIFFFRIFYYCDNMEREEFLKYLRQGKYDKLAKLINSYSDILSFLDELFTSNKKDDVRRALLVLKRLDNEVIERYLYYILLNLNEKRIIAKEAEEILKKITNKESVEEAILEIAKKPLDEKIVYLFLQNMKEGNIFFRAILEHTKSKNMEESIKILLKNYNSEMILKILANKLYSSEKDERELTINILLNIVDSLTDEQKNILRGHLSVSLLGDEDKKLYRKFKQLFEKLDIPAELSDEQIKSLLKSHGKTTLNIILRENIKLPANFYNREFLKDFLYTGDEEKQFVGVKLISLKKDSKKKVDLLFRFLNYGYGKAKTAAIRELKKIAQNNNELKKYIENKTLMYAKKMNLGLKISSLRILKEFAKKEHLEFLINEHKRLKELVYKLEEEKFMGGFRHLLMMEEEIRKCNVAMRLIEEIVAEICLKNDIHYNDLKISEKLGYEFYRTMELIGVKNLNLIDIHEFLEDVKRDGELITYLSGIVINNNKIDDNLAKKILEVTEKAEMEDKDVLNANKIMIYASLNRVDKIGEIINMAEGYYSKLAFINGVKKFIDEKLLDEEKINLLIPKIAEMIYSTKKLRLMALEFFKNYPNELVLPILINEIGNYRGEDKLMIDVISNVIFKYPNNIHSIRELLNTDKRNSALKILLKVSEKRPELLEDFIYLLAGMYSSANEEDKKLIKKILKNITTEEQKLILKPIIGDL